MKLTKIKKDEWVIFFDLAIWLELSEDEIIRASEILTLKERPQKVTPKVNNLVGAFTQARGYC